MNLLLFLTWHIPQLPVEVSPISHSWLQSIYTICGFKPEYFNLRLPSATLVQSKDSLYLEGLKITVLEISICGSVFPISLSVYFCILSVTYSVCLLTMTLQTLFTILSLVFIAISCSICCYYLHCAHKAQRLSTMLKDTQPASGKAGTWTQVAQLLYLEDEVLNCCHAGTQ